jgi:hypothetical protein
MAADEASGTTPDGGIRCVVPGHHYDLVFIGSWQCKAESQEMESPATAAVE